MKKLFLLTTMLMIFAGLFAQSIPKDSAFIVLNKKNENLSESEGNWLPGAVRNKLEANLKENTDFSFVASDTSAVQRLQKQSQGMMYDEADAIEIGKLTSAKFAVFVTLIKSESGYALYSDISDLTTGKNLASAMGTLRKTADELWATTGCAANEITIKLCEQMGVVLSNTRKYALMHGEALLSNDEQLKMAQEEEAAFKKAIAKYDAELKRLSTSTDLDSVAAKTKMEAEKAIAQEKLKAAQEKARRLDEEAKKAAADKAEDAARTEEQKKKRDEMAKVAAKKAAQVRKTVLENESVFTKISVIESKKKAILEIQNGVDARIAEITKDGEAEFAKKKTDIENRPYRPAEKNEDGTPSDTAKERRQKQIRDLRAEIDGRIEKESEDTKFAALGNMADLYAEIKNDQKNLSRTKTVSSLENDLKVQINTFNGKTNAWKVTFWLYSNGMPVTSQSVDMTYKALTGKEIDTDSDAAYDEFIETVDLYNSLFSRGDPVLTFKVRYRTESIDDFTSRYKIVLEGVDIVDTVSGEKKGVLKFSKLDIVQQMQPVYELRGERLERMQLTFFLERIGEYKELSSHNGTLKGGNYVMFGAFPQTIKAKNVKITGIYESYFGQTYYEGSDGAWYAKITSNPRFEETYKFSNGISISKGVEYYFKVEPIKWRVLTNDYNGKKLLLAENILTASMYHSRWNGYKDSTIRAYLNDNFLNVAFTKRQQTKIAMTNVNFRIRENINDKIFLLSEEEVKAESYGFSKYNEQGQENFSRIHTATDYANANGAIGYYGDCWWLRSPANGTFAPVISGYANSNCIVSETECGVVPALVIEN